MQKLLSIIILITFITAVASCSKHKDTDTGPITVEFDNIVGTANLELNTVDTPYTNSEGESYSVSNLTYYVSNIMLKREDGAVFADPVMADGSAGYYLVKEADDSSQEITLENLPAGNYTEVTFTIGVDASRLNQHSQTGPLDPANGLFRNWDEGYTFLTIEGISPASVEEGHVFQFQVSGYKTAAGTSQVNNTRTVTLSFGDHTAPVRPQHEPEVHLLFDINKLLNGPGERVTFASNAIRNSAVASQHLADNIPAAFVVDHIHEN